MRRSTRPYLNRLCALLAFLALFVATGCDLPQDADDAPDMSDASEDTTPAGEIRTWRMLKIIDLSAGDDTLMPGVDVDAIVVFQGDDFVFAGCKGDAVLNGIDDPDMAAESGHDDPSKASLNAVDGDSSSGGFVSLATGVLTCELPVPIETGATISVWEVSSDGVEAWQARLAQDAAGNFEDATGEVSGSASFTAP
jgi:hypothetical protein